MNYNKKTVQDVDVKGKKVLLRCDFNVPQDKETGAITSDKRIVAALPTIKYLLDNGAAVIACSHLGKPKGEWKMKLTLAPVAERLSQLLGREVIFAKDIVGEDAKAKAAALQPGQIMLLENLRFDIREEKNDEAYFEANDRLKIHYLRMCGVEGGQPAAYEGVISKVSSGGLLCDITDLGIYGFVPAKYLAGGMNYNRKARKLRASRGHAEYRVGDFIYLVLDSLDMIHGRALFRPVV